MAPETLPGVDLSTYDVEKRTKTVCSVRVIIISSTGKFILVPYQNTNWLGLPGGKVKTGEYQTDGNLLTTAAHPTLIREVKEECGIDISFYLARSFFYLGLAEVTAIDNTRKIATNILTPISVCSVLQIKKNDLKPETVVMNIEDHLSGPLFPDARIALTFLKKLWQAERLLPVLPVYLSSEKPIFFQTHPTVGPLWGPPEWYK